MRIEDALNAITLEMNKCGEPTRNGGDWHSTTVRNILLREVA